MKPVTVETVRARIEQIEHAINTMPGGFTLSINHQFELSCLQELLALLESRTVTVKLPEFKMLEDYLAEVAVEERKAILLNVRMELHRLLNDAGIKTGIA